MTLVDVAQPGQGEASGVAALDPTQIEHTDDALRAWRQGDCVLGEHWFLLRVDPDVPLTEAAVTASDEGYDAAEEEVLGFMVATQTCDLVRSCMDRPYVELCPLVKADEGELHAIERGRKPGYAFLPALADQALVADLDRVMTAEKPVLAAWDRVSGCGSAAQRRSLSQALARKRNRAAFPDDFTIFARRLRKHLIQKHDKNSEEGEALRALREIRVRAAPDWHADAVHLMFWFIHKKDQRLHAGKPWHEFLENWLGLIPPENRFTEVQAAVVSLEDLTAADYVESDLLDLDHLTTAAPVTKTEDH